MTAVVQFVVLRRENKWVLKSKGLEWFFSTQREAVDAAIRSANNSGKKASPSRRFGHTARAPYPPTKSDLLTMSETPAPRKLAETLG
jgi:hypothetical protein